MSPVHDASAGTPRSRALSGTLVADGVRWGVLAMDALACGGCACGLLFLLLVAAMDAGRGTEAQTRWMAAESAALAVCLLASLYVGWRLVRHARLPWLVQAIAAAALLAAALLWDFRPGGM